MSDLINRQAATQTALEFIVEYLGGAFDEDFQRKLIERMNALPSADSPQGWVDKAISIIDEMEIEGIIAYEQAWEYRMRARMKGADRKDN